jgi:hypothetical protein
VTLLRSSLLVLALVGSCSAPESRVPNAGPRPVVAQPRPHKHRVLLADFALEPAPNGQPPTVVGAVAVRCAQTWSRDSRLACVAPVDVEAAPPSFRQSLFDYVLDGTLHREDDRVTRVTLRASSARSGHEIARVSADCAPTPLGAGAPDSTVIDSLAARIADAVAERPWSTAVLDKAERLLIVGGGAETGLYLGEELVVRKLQAGRFERGIETFVEVPSVEVARVEVEAFVGSNSGSAMRGAQCRLKSGSFGGFEIDQLVVTGDR